MLTPRPHLRRLRPYELPAGAAAPGVGLLQLAQNENFAAPSERALAAARDACAGSARYPDADASGLRGVLAELHGLDAERIVVARGAMELISLLATAYLEPGTSAIVSEYGYLYFRSAIELAGATVLAVPEPGFVVDPKAVANAVAHTTRLVFLANPGNPTGSYLPRDAVAELRGALPDSVLLVIDEAYAEFVDREQYRACFDMVEGGATAVLRTFSKIYGLAGLRVGWGYFPSEIASVLRVVQQPNGVSTSAQAAAAAAVEDRGHVEALQRRTRALRESFIAGLRSLQLRPQPSQGNFVLLQFDSAALCSGADAHLRANAIAARGLHGYGLADCLRITLGTETQMKRVLGSFEQWSSTR